MFVSNDIDNRIPARKSREFVGYLESRWCIMKNAEVREVLLKAADEIKSILSGGTDASDGSKHKASSSHPGAQALHRRVRVALD